MNRPMTAAPTDNPQIGLDEKSFRELAEKRLHLNPQSLEEARTSPSDFDLNPDLAPPDPGVLRPAAVLVPVVVRETLHVLLTQRTSHLAAHAGQVAFPGGKIDAGENALQAALREAHEEIGLERHFIEPLGYLDAYRTGTGYLVTPVVALVAPGFTLTLNTNEVESAFEVPLDFLLDSANHRIDSLFRRGKDRQYYAMPFKERYIWGATAGIIKTLHRRLAAT
jgi:8-oxo-dGTP pyrophosphatase MutT (NUDIX family)